MIRILFLLVLLLSSSSAWSSENNSSQKQLDCLAKGIYYEASGESIEGKIAVGVIILNRVESPKYPKSICGVVHEKHIVKGEMVCQFSWFCNPPKPIKYKEKWEESLDVARNILTYRQSYDRLHGVLFFHEKHIFIPKSWNGNHRVVAVIGNHIFYKRRLA